MIELAVKDINVKKQIGSERLHDAKGDFEEGLEEESKR
jgi:hypothetical protein